jgi:3D (Asp-Asp-Asp) domain-containing protein
MLISRSLVRKLAVMATAVSGFVLFRQSTVIDSVMVPPALQATLLSPAAAPAPVPARVDFTATAYCKGTTTASGVNVRTGIAAADPDLLPVGSVVQLDRLGELYNGIYTIMDTGPAVLGRHIDIYMWNCNEALALGRRDAKLTVLRLGWNPRATAPNLLHRFFTRR